MKDTDIIEEKFGDIELKLLKDKVLKDVADILHQASDKDTDFLYPVIKYMPRENIKGGWVGWDYGHSGDFTEPPATEPHNAIYFGQKKEMDSGRSYGRCD